MAYESIGYQLLFLKCRRCGHQGEMPEGRILKTGGRPYCGQCKSYEIQTTVVWHVGEPPDNVVPLKRSPTNNAPE